MDETPATSNLPTKGMQSVTHPGGLTALSVLAAVAGVVLEMHPHTWYEWLLAGCSAVLAIAGVILPKASVGDPK